MLLFVRESPEGKLLYVWKFNISVKIAARHAALCRESKNLTMIRTYPHCYALLCASDRAPRANVNEKIHRSHGRTSTLTLI